MSQATSSQELAEAVAARTEAERANKAKSRFLAAASHDLRQPLQALRLLNAALQEYLLTDDMAMNILHDSERALEVMDRLLGSLLDISKVDSGIINPDMRDFRLSDIFDDLQRDFLRITQEKNLDFSVVPSSAVVRTDRILLDSILRNFLGNAVRYTKRGKLLLGCRKIGEVIRIEVWDTGMGIPDAELNNIFDEFYQIGTPDRDSSQGLGLGLAIVRAYARLMRCQIRVQSRLGKGSVFSIEVPLGNIITAGETRRDDANASIGWKQKTGRVLLVEDDEPILQAMQKLLEIWGMQALCVRSGDEAEQKLKQNKFAPDIVISDYRLANGETGIAVLDRIAPLLAENIPVIFITGDVVSEVRAALGTRFAHLLQKPVAPGKLRVLIRNLLAPGQADGKKR